MQLKHYLLAPYFGITNFHCSFSRGILYTRPFLKTQETPISSDGQPALIHVWRKLQTVLHLQGNPFS